MPRSARYHVNAIQEMQRAHGYTTRRRLLSWITCARFWHTLTMVVFSLPLRNTFLHVLYPRARLSITDPGELVRGGW